MAKKKPPVHCRICKQIIDRNIEQEGVDWIMPSRNYFYHKDCYDDWVKKKQNAGVLSNENEEFWKMAMLDYLKKDLKISVDYKKIMSQWKNLIKQRKTPKGIYFAVKYFYDIKKGNPEKCEGGIGIVSYVYQDSAEYWTNQERKNKGLLQAIERQLQEKNNQETIKIKRKKTKKQKVEFDLSEVEAYDR